MTADGTLAGSTLAFAGALATTSDLALIEDWPAQSPAGAFWHGYDESLREVAFRVYQQLRGLAVEIETSRTPATAAQRILAQYQRAYRDLTGALAGVQDDEFDQAPAENEWPLRAVMSHIAIAERGFHALIHWAVDRRRAGDVAAIVMPDNYRDAVSDPIVETGTMADVLDRYDALHSRVLSDFVGLDADDLVAPNVWWEGYEVPVQFRLHRFDSHLREHTIQIDKTLAGIGHPPTEPEQLARLIHGALGQVEGAAIGASGESLDRQRVTAAEIDALAAGLR